MQCNASTYIYIYICVANPIQDADRYIAHWKDGKHIGASWYNDFGELYYRTDLLEKYNFSHNSTPMSLVASFLSVYQSNPRVVSGSHEGSEFP